MAFDFPASPVNGQTFSPSGGPVYVYDSARGAWGSASVGPLATISDVPPSNPVPGQLWFESDSGNTYIYYDDGNSKQWVQVNGLLVPGAVRHDIAQGLTLAQQGQARANLGTGHADIAQTNVGLVSFTGLPPGANGMDLSFYNTINGTVAGQQYILQMRNNAGGFLATGYRGSQGPTNAAPAASSTTYVSVTPTLTISTGIAGNMRLARMGGGWAYSGLFSILGSTALQLIAGDITGVGANPTGFQFGLTNGNLSPSINIGIDYW